MELQLESGDYFLSAEMKAFKKWEAKKEKHNEKVVEMKCLVAFVWITLKPTYYKHRISFFGKSLTPCPLPKTLFISVMGSTIF